MQKNVGDKHAAPECRMPSTFSTLIFLLHAFYTLFFLPATQPVIHSATPRTAVIIPYIFI